MFEYIKKQLNSLQFNHLKSVRQNYIEHLSDSMNYSWKSLKSSFYFFCHGLYPDIFEKNGSKNIHNLNNLIQDKLNNL